MPIYLRSSKVNRWQIQRRLQRIANEMNFSGDWLSYKRKKGEGTNKLQYSWISSSHYIQQCIIITSQVHSLRKMLWVIQHPSAAFEEMPKPHSIKYTMFDGLSCIWPLQYTLGEKCMYACMHTCIHSYAGTNLNNRPLYKWSTII
jgi:hypothetical protein